MNTKKLLNAVKALDNAPVPAKDRTFYFYSDSTMEMPILNRFKYQGRGRSRKTDYASPIKRQKQINAIMNKIVSVRQQ